MRRFFPAALLAAAAGILAATPPDRDGLLGLNKTHSAQTLGKGRLLISAYSHWIDGNGILQDGEITRDGLAARPSRLSAVDGYLSAAYGFGRSLDAAIGLPMHYEDIGMSGDAAGGFSQGEAKAFVKYGTPWVGSKQPWAIAFQLGGSAPTAPGGTGIIPREMEYVPGDTAALEGGSRSYGTGGPEIYFSGAFTYAWARSAHPPFPLSLHFNAGYRKPFASAGGFEDVLNASAVLEFEFDNYYEMFAEAYHETRTGRAFSAGEWETEPTTLTIAGVATTSYGLQLQAGVAFGLLNGGSTPVTHYDAGGAARESFGLKGSAPVSFTLGISWKGVPPNLDLDLDGVADKVDQCRFSREDRDGYQDEDGCPEPGPEPVKP
ncbi:MAG TPA: hypothetical protein VJ385_12810 [Fibrobacteria bacterium]|nr:hypothetical protein [Fibrobacteria bacterium]